MTSTISPPDTATQQRDFPFRSSISTHPAPMTVSKNSSTPTKASLDILISNDGFSHVELESLTITFKVADNDWAKDTPGMLTPVWNRVSAPKPELPPGWTEDTSNPKSGAFTFKPQNKKAGPNDVLRLHLDNIHVSTKTGITNVVISVKTPSGTPKFKTATHSIGKFPIGFELKNFRADDPIVENGQSTKINWTTDGDDNVIYQFFVDGVEKKDGVIKPPFDTGPLHATTVYKITAKHQVGDDWIPYSDSTVVHVHGGELTASKISCDQITASKADFTKLQPAFVELLASWEEKWEWAFFGDDYPKTIKQTSVRDRPLKGLLVGELVITFPSEGLRRGKFTLGIWGVGKNHASFDLPISETDPVLKQQIFEPFPRDPNFMVSIQVDKGACIPQYTQMDLKLYWLGVS
ncbi:hypothetical protein [Spirillospora sp. NPDC029432]|uniref:hypothetical protein n=1 Tax=Spirillospora sp. NPDC029432 TaxID=3154599 RepID=UPI003453DB74